MYKKSDSVKSKYDEYLPHKLDYKTVRKENKVEIMRERLTSADLLEGTEIFLHESSQEMEKFKNEVRKSLEKFKIKLKINFSQSKTDENHRKKFTSEDLVQRFLDEISHDKINYQKEVRKYLIANYHNII